MKLAVLASVAHVVASAPTFEVVASAPTFSALTFEERIFASFSNGVQREDNTTQFPFEDGRLAVYHPSQKLDVAKPDGAFGTFFADGSRVIHFPNGMTLKTFANLTKVVYSRKDGTGKANHNDGSGYAHSVVFSDEEMADDVVNSAVQTNGRKLLSSASSSFAFQLCGNYCGPGWCSAAWEYECGGAASVSSSGSYPVCLGTDNCAANSYAYSDSKTGSSCVDTCAKVHDNCCKSRRAPCNEAFISCLNKCPTSETTAGGYCPWWASGTAGSSARAYSKGTPFTGDSIQGEDVVAGLEGNLFTAGYGQYSGMCCGTNC